MFKMEFKNFETQIERVRACSVNAVDTKVRRGVYDDYPTTTNVSHVHTRSLASMVRARSRMSSERTIGAVPKSAGYHTLGYILNMAKDDVFSAYN